MQWLQGFMVGGVRSDLYETTDNLRGSMENSGQEKDGRKKRWTPDVLVSLYERRERGERAADMAKELNVCVSRIYYLSQWGARIVRQRASNG